MATLEELVAATKILSESAGEAIKEPNATGFSGLELGENGVEVSELNKADGDNDYSVCTATKRAVETKRNVGTTFVGGGRLQSHLNVEENEEKAKGAENENLASSDDKSVSVREEECNQNGINLIVDVLGSLDCVDGSKKYYETDGGESSSVKNGGGLNITCVLDIIGGDYKEEEDGVFDKQEHGFCVGDFVWGKIRGHPWWPGQIYGPQDASDFAVKHSQRGRLLVAFFGDGSGSWCLPTQLIPFSKNFEEMSKGSSSKSFLNAVQRSIDEVGRVLELEMSCKCIAEERKVGLARLLVVNAGLKPGVLMPEVDINRLSVPRYKPAEVLAKVMNFAQAVSVGSMLELAVLKSWLSSFYRSKGGYQLAVYYDAHQIEGLEDTSEIGDAAANGFSLPIEGPILGPLEDDWLSSSCAGMLQSPAPSGDKIYRRRKQKSVAELMGETADIKLKDKKRTAAKDGTDVVKPTSGTRRKSKYLSPIYTERVNEVSAVENIVGEEANEATPRERKKSKYLSAPYTNLKRRVGNLSSKGESEIESEKMAKIVPVDERTTKADRDLFPSPSVFDPVSANVLTSRQQQKGIDSSTCTSSQQDEIHENDLKKIFDTVDVDASGNGVLSKVQSAAVNPLYLSKEGSLDMIREFFSAFRSSIYLNGSNFKEFHGHQRGKKRKLLHSDPENRGNDTSETKSKTSEPKIPEAGIDRSASSASLLITLSPGFTLPSKDDVIGMFSKFVSPNGKETNLVMDSSTVQVEYVKNSDAEAFRSSVSDDVFGSAILNCRIQHSSVTPEKSGSTKLGDDVISDMGFINQKLEMMSRMLGKCDCKISSEKLSLKDEMKDEMKRLLEKVGTAAEKVRTIVESTST